MFNEENIKDFFDKKAKNWDKTSISNPVKIINNLNIKNKDILDVGCGTGILEKYLSEAKSLDCIDLSQKMIDIAKEKYPNINYLCTSIYDYHPNKKYDLIIMYNVYPHLIDKKKLIAKVYNLLKKNGSFIVAHGDGKDGINDHHKHHAKQISSQLKSAKEESKIWKDKFKITNIVDEEDRYYFSGIAR